MNFLTFILNEKFQLPARTRELQAQSACIKKISANNTNICNIKVKISELINKIQLFFSLFYRCPFPCQSIHLH